MKLFQIVVCTLLCVLFFSCNSINAQNNYTNISAEELAETLSKETIQLIDVRTPQEFSQGHIETSVNIDFLSENFNKNIEVLDKTKPVYVYCKSGRRSAKSTEAFKSAGFNKIYNLYGGFLNWNGKKYKIVK